MNTTLIMLFLSSLSALLIGWAYFERYRLPRPPIGVFNLWDVALVMAGILLVPYLYLALPVWLVATLLGLSALSLLSTYFQPILADQVATWAITLALAGAEVAAFVYLGAGNGLFFAINNSIQLLAAVTVANLWAQCGLKGRDAAILAGALVIYDALFTLAWPLMERLFVHLAGLPFAPLVVWPGADGQWAVIGLGDLILATVLPLVLRREVGRGAGVVALTLNGLALAGVLLLPALGLWQTTFPVMVVLGPLLIGQVAFWHWRGRVSRTFVGEAEQSHTNPQRTGQIVLPQYRQAMQP